MGDVITSEQTITISVIIHGDCIIENLTYPSTVEVGEEFNIAYDCVNNGNEDSCFGQIMKDNTLIPGSRWDQTLANGATKSSDIPISGGIQADSTFVIQVGYTN